MWNDKFYENAANNPNWVARSYVHDWERYVGEDLRAMWPYLDLKVRIAIVRSLQDIADVEEWE